MMKAGHIFLAELQPVLSVASSLHLAVTMLIISVLSQAQLSYIRGLEIQQPASASVFIRMMSEMPVTVFKKKTTR